MTGSSDLKSSQAYPKGLGEAFVQVYNRHRSEMLAAKQDLEPCHGSLHQLLSAAKGRDVWGDAELQACLNHLLK